jgi:hypothetical protein
MDFYLKMYRKWGREKKQKKRHRGPNIQIVTVGHYYDLKMVVLRAQFLFEWSPCTTNRT